MTLALVAPLALGFGGPASAPTLRAGRASPRPQLFLDELRESVSLRSEAELGDKPAMRWSLQPRPASVRVRGEPAQSPAPPERVETADEDGMLWAWQLGLLAITACWGANFA